jgi:ArsR family transcriptional regulator
MDIKKIEKISKALGDPYRLKIMETVEKEHNWLQCATIVDMFDLTQSTVSHHLKQLVDSDLLIAEKEGRTAKYHINNEVFREYIQFLTPFGKEKEV